MPAGKKKKGAGKKKGGAGAAAEGGPVADPPDVQFRRMVKAFKARKAAPEGAAPIARMLKSIQDASEEKDFEWPRQFVVAQPVSPDAVEALCAALRECPYAPLRSLCFWNADIGDAGAAAAARLVRYLPGLGKLEMLDCQVGERGCRVLADELSRSGAHHLQILRLDHNDLGTAGARRLAGGLARAAGLRTLSLGHCGVGPEGGAALGAMLESPQCDLRMLSVEGNRLGAAGVAALGRGLAAAANKKLTYLNAALNYLGPELRAVRALADGLAAHPELASVNLDGNLIGDAAAVALADRLHDTKITELVLTASLGRAAFLYAHEVIAAHRPPPAKKKKGKKGKKKK